MSASDFMRDARALVNRVRLSIARGTLHLVNAGQAVQTMQATFHEGETRDGLEHFEGYGFTSNPPAGCEVAAVFVGGDRSHGIIVGIGDRAFRLAGLASGEVALYTDEGDTLVFKRGRKLEIDTLSVLIKAPEGVRCETPKFECTGEIKDMCDTQSMTMQSMRQLYDAHTHKENDNGRNTNTPNQTMEGR